MVKSNIKYSQDHREQAKEEKGVCFTLDLDGKDSAGGYPMRISFQGVTAPGMARELFELFEAWRKKHLAAAKQAAAG